jgi:nucleoside-triphosphatase
MTKEASPSKNVTNAAVSVPSTPHGPLILVTGPPHSGKSSMLANLLQQMRALGWRMAGILAEGHWQNGRRSGFTLIDLQSGRRTPLARRITVDDPRTFPYVFFPMGIAAGRRALSPTRCLEADLMVVDEVGSLEIRGGGWADRLPPLLQQTDTIHLWIVQSKRVAAVCDQWQLTPHRIIDATAPDARLHLHETLLAIGSLIS